MEDSQIIDLYLNRNEKAIEETDNKYHNFCYTIAFNILHNAEDSNEAVNDTYLGTWNSIPPNVPKILSAFIGRITRNICLKKTRLNNSYKRGNGEAKLVFDEISELIRSQENIENEIETKELADFIAKFLYSIGETERNVFICRYWYFDSVADISTQFGFSKSKVKSMLFRIRKKLYKRLTEEKIL